MRTKPKQILVVEESVQIPVDGVILGGRLVVPEHANGLVVFVHGSGSSRFSPRNAEVAEALQDDHMATLLFDLLTPEEAHDRANVFDMELLSRRTVAVTDWVRRQPTVRTLPVGYFGASTGGGAALIAASQRPDDVVAVVSRGGRPDLADSALEQVKAATLLIVGERDPQILELNEQALDKLTCDNRLFVIPEATHLFAEPGTLERVSRVAALWFRAFFREAQSHRKVPR